MTRRTPSTGPDAPSSGPPKGSGPRAEGEFEPSPPEFMESGEHLFVTVDLPEIPAGELAHYVGTNLLVLWRHGEPEDAARVIRFPKNVQPEKAVLRVNNGVLDLEVPLAREAASPSTSDSSSPDSKPTTGGSK